MHVWEESIFDPSSKSQNLTMCSARGRIEEAFGRVRTLPSVISVSEGKVKDHNPKMIVYRLRFPCLSGYRRLGETPRVSL